MPLRVSCAAEGPLGSMKATSPTKGCVTDLLAPALCGSSIHSCIMQSLRQGGCVSEALNLPGQPVRPA